MSVPLNRAQRGRQSGSGLFASGEGEKEDILLLSRNTETDRQTERREEKVSTDLCRGTQLLSFPVGNFLFQNGYTHLGGGGRGVVIFCLSNPRYCWLKTRESSPSRVAFQDKVLTVSSL